MSGYVSQPAEPASLRRSTGHPVAPLDRTGGYLGPTGQAALTAASRATPARWQLLLRRPTFFVGAGILLFWVVCALFGHLIAPYNPLAQNLLSNNTAPSGAHWFGTDSARPGRAVPGHRRRQGHPDHHPAGHRDRHRSSAPPSGWPWATSAAPST